MNSSPCDVLSRALSARQARRALLRALGGATLAAPLLADTPETDAKRHRRKARGKAQAIAERKARGKKTMCVNGVTKKVGKNRRKKVRQQGATRGACPCEPQCAGKCGISDGCGGICPGCAGGSVCADGECRACTVSCPTGSIPAQCGTALAAALTAGADVYVCPGTYEGFHTLTNVEGRMFGAGSGEDPSHDTILTTQPGPNNDSLLTVAGASVYRVATSRITGSYTNGHGGGIIVTDSATLTLTGCAVVGNRAGGEGGGVAVRFGASLHLDDCDISANTGDSRGGGLGVSGICTATNTRVTGNSSQFGGGVYLQGGILTLDSSVSITGNEAIASTPEGGGVWVGLGTLNRNGATISGNTPASSQCYGTGC